MGPRDRLLARASWRRYLRFWGPDVDGEVDVELRFHFESRVEELTGRGLAPDAARRQALEEFGDPGPVREGLRAIDRRVHRQRARALWWDALLDDVRYALRGLRRAPGFTAAVVVTLGLAVGANAAMFGIVDRRLLRAPAHVRDPERVARVYLTQTFSWAGEVTQTSAAYVDYAILRDEARSFEQVAAIHHWTATLGRGAEARPVRRTAATASFFPLLGVQPTLGRFFAADEDRVPAGAAVAVVSHALWRSEFGGDPGVLGRTIVLAGKPYTVIGVAPARFTGVDLERSDVWVPLTAIDMPDRAYGSRSMLWLRLLVRVGPGVAAAQANAEATRLFRRVLAERVDPSARATLGSIVPGRTLVDEPARQSARVAAWLAAMAAIVLLVACSNIANLLLTRAARRRREIAVRLALGVSRRRLIAQLLTESAVLALLGSAAALLVIGWGGRLIRDVLLPGIAWETAPVDGRVLAFTALLAVATSLLVGLAPAVQASRPGIVGALKAGVRDGTFRRSRTRAALLVCQAALSVLLLVGAGLFVRSLWTIAHMDMGLDAPRTLVADLDLTEAGYTAAATDAYYRAARERVLRLPGVETAAVGMAIPFYSSIAPDLSIPGRDSLPMVPDGGPYVDAVTPDYFETLGMRLARGRGFTAADGKGSPRVAVVSETMARLVWPGEDALGKCLKVGGDTVPCSEVVGVLRDSRRQRLEPVPVMQYYVPLDQGQVDYADMRALFVRANGDPGLLTAPIRRELQGMAANLPYINVRPLQTLIDPQIRPWRLGAAAFAAFGLLALAIASVGLYGVMAYEVGQRMHEFGVRMALGAQPRRVVGLVVRQGLGFALAGVGLGLLVALAAAGRIEPLLFGTSATDPAIYAAVAAALLAVAMLAIALPAWRATRVNPARALQSE